MYEQVEKPKENKNRAVANTVTQTKNSVKDGFGFVDNRQEYIIQRKNHSPSNNTDKKVVQAKIVTESTDKQLQYFEVLKLVECDGLPVNDEVRSVVERAVIEPKNHVINLENPKRLILKLMELSAQDSLAATPPSKVLEQARKIHRDEMKYDDNTQDGLTIESSEKKQKILLKKGLYDQGFIFWLESNNVSEEIFEDKKMVVQRYNEYLNLAHGHTLKLIQEELKGVSQEQVKMRIFGYMSATPKDIHNFYSTVSKLNRILVKALDSDFQKTTLKEEHTASGFPKNNKRFPNESLWRINCWRFIKKAAESVGLDAGKVQEPSGETASTELMGEPLDGESKSFTAGGFKNINLKLIDGLEDQVFDDLIPSGSILEFYDDKPGSGDHFGIYAGDGEYISKNDPFNKVKVTDAEKPTAIDESYDGLQPIQKLKLVNSGFLFVQVALPDFISSH